MPNTINLDDFLKLTAQELCHLLIAWGDAMPPDEEDEAFMADVSSERAIVDGQAHAIHLGIDALSTHQERLRVRARALR